MTGKFSHNAEMRVWALINDLCNVTQVRPDEFQAEVHVQKAQIIIDTIDDSIDYSSDHQIQSHRKKVLGSDGPYCLSQGGKIIEESHHQWGADERRVGHYLVQKRRLDERESLLEFEYFRSSDVWNFDDHSSLKTVLQYNTKSKELLTIYTALFEPWYLRLGPIIIGHGRVNKTYFWKKGARQ